VVEFGAQVASPLAGPHAKQLLLKLGFTLLNFEQDADSDGGNQENASDGLVHRFEDELGQIVKPARRFVLHHQLRDLALAIVVIDGFRDKLWIVRW